MPSDDRTKRALAALARPRDAFLSAVVAAVDELRGFLARQRAPAESRTQQEAARLGAFAAQHIDTERFSVLIGAPGYVEPQRLDRLEQKLALLHSFAEQGDSLFRVSVQPGADLHAAVSDALAARGCVFRAAHEAGLLRNGEPPRTPHTEVSLCFRQWRRAEKAVAPPLVVELSGADLAAGALADFMDGAQKIVLIVDGTAALAPLARLITPRTFVLQTSDAAELDRLGAYDGPGIAAVLPAGSARFVHDPARGTSLAQRLDITYLPEPAAAPVGGRPAADELAWLAELGRMATALRDATAPAPAAEAAPADQLAAWLLRLSTDGEAVPAAGS